jgi:hypothetical protein
MGAGQNLSRWLSLTAASTRQPMSTLLCAPQEQAKREKQTVGGLQYNRNNKREVESMQ